MVENTQADTIPSKWVKSHAPASPVRLLEAVALTPIRSYADRNRPQPRRGGARPSASLLAPGQANGARLTPRKLLTGRSASLCARRPAVSCPGGSTGKVGRSPRYKARSSLRSLWTTGTRRAVRYTE